MQEVNRRAHPNVPLPRVLHAIQRVKPGSRVIIIGDVHGCLDEVKLLLEKCNYTNENDTLIFVGDLVNKGPKSAEVVRFVRESGALCVRGNHDDAALNAFYNKTKELDDRYAYVNSLSADDIDFLEQLPFTIDLPDINAMVVHAGIVPGLPLDDQNLNLLYKIRFIKTVDCISIGLESNDEGCAPWATQYHGPKLIVFGHDAKTGLQDTPFALGLDTGCCYGKFLTAAILPERNIVSIKALATYTLPKS